VFQFELFGLSLKGLVLFSISPPANFPFQQQRHIMYH
jgi:hypothetical protein